MGSATCWEPARRKISSRVVAWASRASNFSADSAAMGSRFVTREDATHRLDEVGFGDGELRLGLLLQIFVAVLDGSERGTEDQVLDGDLALGALIAALDDDARAAASVGIFHLRLHARLAEIELGADVRFAKL